MPSSSLTTIAQSAAEGQSRSTSPHQARTLEAEASVFRDYQPSYIPGLLQTEDYSRAVLAAAPGSASADEVERGVSLRMKRQGILTKEQPPELWFVISEAALRVKIGTPSVLSAQLRHLTELAARPNITVQVLPLSASAHVSPVSGFRLLEFPDPRDPNVVYIEHLTGALFLEQPEDIARYRLVFDHLRAEASGISSSLDLITRIADEVG